MDRGAWWAIVYGVAVSQTGLKRLGTNVWLWRQPALFESSPADSGQVPSPVCACGAHRWGSNGVSASLGPCRGDSASG